MPRELNRSGRVGALDAELLPQAAILGCLGEPAFDRSDGIFAALKAGERARLDLERPSEVQSLEFARSLRCAIEVVRIELRHRAVPQTCDASFPGKEEIEEDHGDPARSETEHLDPELCSHQDRTWRRQRENLSVCMIASDEEEAQSHGPGRR